MIKLLPFVALFIAAQAQLRTPTNNLLGLPQNRPSNVPAAPRPVFDNSGDDGSNEPAKPYEFSYDAPDGQGNTHTRSESFDGRTTRGSYSYTDADGVYRQVDYISDENGYRADVRTNEPGTGPNPDPAQGDPNDTNWFLEPPPAAVSARWANFQPAPAPVAFQPAPVIRFQPPAPVQPVEKEKFVLVPESALRNLNLPTDGSFGRVRSN